MGNTVAQQTVTQSRFFTQDFNTAIIDGPLRIYFADRQESEALQLYFHIQEKLEQTGLHLNAIPVGCPSTFLMLYADSKVYGDIFSSKKEWSSDLFGIHQIMGVNMSELQNHDDIVLNVSRNIQRLIDVTA